MEQEIEKSPETINSDKRNKKKSNPRRRVLAFIRRLGIKESSSSSSSSSSSAWRWRWRYLGSAFKWKLRTGNWNVSFVYDVLFKIVSVLEAIVLVGSLCFFFLFCGCHI